MFRLIYILTLALLAQQQNLFAQHPIDVQRYSARGEHLLALHTFDKIPQRKTTLESRIAAARSAWALGLSSRALEEFDRALGDESLEKIERARIQLSKGIIEFQEQRPRVAMLYAEKAASLLPEAGPLRARAWVLWGDALYELESLGAAAEKYEIALEETPVLETPDIYYRLGICQLKLGQPKAAQKSFEQIPMDHDRAASAIRYLAQIAFDNENIEHAAFWLKQGRSQYPEQFLDSWVDYSLMRVALSTGDQDSIQELKSAAEQKYPPSDYWLTMLQAAVEVHAWKNLHKEGVK